MARSSPRGRKLMTEKAAKDLKPIKGLENFYVSGSGYIYYIRGPHRFSTKTKSRQAAKRFVEIELLRRSGMPVAKAKRKAAGVTDPYIEEIWQEMIAIRSVGKSVATKRSYNKEWRNGIEGFWGKELPKGVKDTRKFKVKRRSRVSDLVKPENIDAFKIWTLEENPTRHFEKTLTYFRMLLKFALDREYIGKMPKTDTLKDVNDTTKASADRLEVGRVYTRQEQRAMLCQALMLYRQGFIPYRGYVILLTLQQTGVRIEEALALPRLAIDRKRKVLTVKSTKGKKRTRQVAMTRKLFKVLTAFADQSTNDFIFPGKSVPHIYRQVFSDEWVKIKKAAGISGWDVKNAARLHDWRHSFASATADDNWPPVAAIKVLDMSLKVYLATYCHPDVMKMFGNFEKSFGDNSNENNGEFHGRQIEKLVSKKS